MKRLLIISLLLVNFAQVKAQDTIPARTARESTNIFDILDRNTENGGTVIIEQSESMKKAVNHHISSNGRRKVSGYRVRIFYDNAQNARAKAQSVASSFSSMYPKVGVYKSYDNPFFRVSVGDFKERSDAQRFADQLRSMFPSAFIVKETINVH